jgi:hypothetical protein
MNKSEECAFCIHRTYRFNLCDTVCLIGLEFYLLEIQAFIYEANQQQNIMLPTRKLSGGRS